jgi:hypothetical protein
MRVDLDLVYGLDDLLENTRLSGRPDPRHFTDGVDDPPGGMTAQMRPQAGNDGVDLPGARDLKEQRKLEEMLFGIDRTTSCDNCQRAAAACLCGKFSDLAPRLKAPPAAAPEAVSA